MVCNSMPLDGSCDRSAVCLTEIGVTYGGSYDIKSGTQHLVILGQQRLKKIQPVQLQLERSEGKSP